MHKLLFDQNLSYRIVKQLKHLFPDSSHVRLLKLEKADDVTIWQYARDNNFHIISKDTDFNNLNAFYGYPPKVIWIHTGNMTTRSIIELLQKKAETIHAFLDNEQTGLLELA